MINGIRLEGKKESTLLFWTLRRFDPPKKVRIPLLQASGVSAKLCVSAGDKVKTGQVIAHPQTPESVFVHSSISGTVTGVGLFLHPVKGSVEMVEIEADIQEQKVPDLGVERKNWEKLDRAELLEIFRSSGLVDLGRENPAVHFLAAKEIKTLILNACEMEPYQTCDHAVMMSHPLEVLKGAEFLRKATGAERVVIVTQDDKLEVAETLKSKIFFMKWKNYEVEIIPAIYPHGQNEILKRNYPEDSEIFNIATAYAVYEAAALQKPFFERAVTVAGECVIEPKNIWARIGTDFEAVVKYGKGFLRPPGKVLMGGPMTGIAQETLDACVVPATQALLGLPEELVQPGTEQPCIRCGACVEVCPVSIHPAMITLAAEQNLFSLTQDYGVQACIECGNCTYICPSKRPMAELIRYALGKEKAPQNSGKKTKRRKAGRDI